MPINRTQYTLEELRDLLYFLYAEAIQKRVLVLQRTIEALRIKKATHAD